MKTARHLWMPGLFLLALLFAVLSASDPQPVRADDTGKRTVEERRQEKAYALRENAKQNAQRNLGYGFVYPQEHDREIDFYYVGMQIERLGALMQQWADVSRARQTRKVIPGPPLGLAGPAEAGLLPDKSVHPDVAGIYGPAGPTSKSVRLILEYRLMVAGNPRLKVGAVKEEDERILAEVVTIDGSLVDQYAIDKKSGVWVPIR